MAGEIRKVPNELTAVGVITTTVDGITTTPTDGLVVQNTTPTTVGVQVQESPRVLLTGQGWDTDDAVSRPVRFFVDSLPVAGTGVAGTFRIGYLNAVNDAITYPLTVGSNGNVTVLAGVYTTNDVIAGTARALGWNTRASLSSPANGIVNVTLGDASIGAQLKADALPTIASGFGSSPSITAGSTALAGQVNVGTGGAATSGVINFNGTAFASAPFVIAMNSTTGALLKAVATTTQLTITANAAFVASDKVNWICIGSK